MSRPLRLRRIISGGQTGADYGGLLAAEDLGLETGGTAPHGFWTEDGQNLELRDRFGLAECESPAIPARTVQNVTDADATVLFSRDVRSPGSRLTINTCRRLGKPLVTNPSPSVLREFLRDTGAEVLNVAGNRESVSPGTEVRVRAYVIQALQGHLSLPR